MQGGPQVTGAQAQPPRLGKMRWRTWAIVGLFVLPALGLYALLVLLPIAQAGFYSLFDWNGLKPLTDFVGLENYQKALSDRVFHSAVSHNALIVILSLVIQIPFALGLALLLNRDFPGRAVLRLLFFAPYVIAEVIAGIVFQLMLVPGGMVDQVLESFGLRLTGYLAWLGWLVVHLLFLVGFRNRVIVLLNWAYSYFTYDRGLRLITGLKPVELQPARQRFQRMREVGGE